ncbi:MAG: hypothetical protein IIW27_01550, partial [Clostridia bacterium]|nr:hypothetical protein [Clostridia bacterium]
MKHQKTAMFFHIFAKNGTRITTAEKNAARPHPRTKNFPPLLTKGDRCAMMKSGKEKLSKTIFRQGGSIMKKQLLLFAILVVSLTCFACSQTPAPT